MKKILLLIVASLIINNCFAEPTVEDVKQAMQSNNPQLVEQLSKEVLAHHPNSAKAHYFLGEAYLHENKRGLAVEEFNQAQSLEPDLSFASSKEEFRRVYNSAVHNLSNPQVLNNSYSNSSTQNSGIASINALLLGVLILGVIIWLFRYFIRQKSAAGNGYMPPFAANPNSTDYSPGVNPNTYNNPGTPNYQPSRSGLGNVGSFVAGAAAGVVADELLSRAGRNNYPEYTNNQPQVMPNDTMQANQDWDTGNSSASWDNDASSSADDSWNNNDSSWSDNSSGDSW